MSIKPSQFEVGIGDLYRIWQTLPRQTGICRWKSLQIRENFGLKYLTIVANVDEPLSQLQPADLGGHDETRDADDKDGEIYEIDDETVQPRTPVPRPATEIACDVIYSAAYQVPVLYLTPTTKPTSRGPSLINELYLSIVPSHRRGQLENVGTLGALSMTDHPVTGLPMCFVHPCRTQEAMLAAIGGRDVSAIEYLMLWFGLVGSSVALDVPIELAIAAQEIM
ncbi:hypothetical protein K431DRAFT_285917 [Polychaeton citri CBS 116435]|uniref:Ubiquitin-like-conjugating enzyme ATG10 n=1 Tax=Polychaeton citri CBS 116435 TaxID=1314669 RepID=A0A9P4Q883_9PEZI|nr:hypothetical protein K431DRAFT_285917 [Polychaeton citri CBS 116435]